MSSPDTTINFRDKNLAEFYDTNYGRDRRYLCGKTDVNRYRWLIEQETPKFSKDEAISIWSALNGTNTSHTEMLPILQKSIASELDKPLKSRVLSLSKIEWLAVVDACDRVGCGQNSIPDLASELRRVGLID